ncbi:hypothetical protein B484DRAFT_407189 [Ochromonadaceae sp. CCMP2298]|nr:hypothetical protein B484DRAFT_407189 [Ochromonadaceae sp. CCMP2298]
MQLPSYFDVKGNGLVPSLCRLYYFMLQVLLLELRSTDKFRLTLRRAAIYTFFFCLLPTLMIWNHAGLYLDDILFPSWKTQEIKQPLFLVGNARSGTTWLHRLITHDADRFATFKSWELAFAVSVSWRYLFHSLYALDRLLGGAVYSTLMAIESHLVGHIHVHPIGLMEAEEDEWLMAHIACAQLLLFFFPLGGSVINDLILFDHGPMSASTRRDVFHFYKQCTIYETFPDARVVCLLRDPQQSIPSMISYISKVWHAFAEPVERYPDAQGLLGFCEAHYLYPLTQLCAPRAENTWDFLSYHLLLEDLEGTVARLLLRLYGESVPGGAGDTGDTGSQNAFRRFLRSEQSNARQYKTQHMHSIQQCCGGMSEAELKGKLAEVYAKHSGAF